MSLNTMLEELDAHVGSMVHVDVGDGKNWQAYKLVAVGEDHIKVERRNTGVQFMIPELAIKGCGV